MGEMRPSTSYKPYPTDLRIGQHVLEVVITDKPDPSFDRVAYDQCRASCIETRDALAFESVPDDCYWTLFLMHVPNFRFRQDGHQVLVLTNSAGYVTNLSVYMH